MPLLMKARSFLRNLFLSRRAEVDLDQEVHAHLELLIAENIRAGIPPKEAERAARIELGGIEQVKELVRERRIGNWLRSVISDCRYGLRQLRRNPGFIAVAVLTLALGIGANTAIFTLVHAILLKSLPVPHPEQLYNFGDDQDCCSLSGSQDSFTVFSFPLYKEIRDHTPEFSEIAAFQAWVRNVSVRRGFQLPTSMRVGG